MKLAFLIYSYFPYGGQQRDFHRIVSESLARGHDVKIYTLKWQGPLLPDAQLTFVPVSSFRRINLYRKFTRWVLQALQEDPCDAVVGFNKMPGLDIYFAADPCFAEKAARQRGAYYRFTPRFRHFKQYEEAVFSAHCSTRAMMLTSLQMADYLKHYPDCESRLDLVPPGIDRDRMDNVDDATSAQKFRLEVGVTGEDLLIVQIGSGFRIKGVDRSLTAIASLPETLLKRTRFVLIGQDKPGRYQHMAKQLGIAHRVSILPGRDDIPQILRAADLLLHPAYLESAGYILLEAIIAGLPVLTTATCGYACHVEQSGAGIVCAEPFSQAQLSRHLLHMLTSPERSTWSSNGRHYGQQDELYAGPRVAVDLIEHFVNQQATK